MTEPDLEEYYQLLGLSKEASVDDIQQAYFRCVAQVRRQGNKETLESLKVAYTTLTEYSLNKNLTHAQETPKQVLSELINQGLEPHNMQAEVKIQEPQLRIIFDGQKTPQYKVPITLIQAILTDVDLPNINTVKIYGMTPDKKILWRSEFPLTPTPHKQRETQELIKEAESNTNTFAIPIAVVIALALNFTGISWLWTIWVHELGHSSIAWFSGYHALPTLALTIMSTERSLFVYFGILFLIGLLFWSGWKEQKKWSMGLAIGLSILQFYMTWLMPSDTYDQLQAFGGVGGEFYLSAFFIVCFYMSLPEKLYWEFWRYIVLIIASSTLLSSWWKWQSISQGKESIPWGTFWGGQGDGGGDMDTLVAFGWGDLQIINTYKTLGNLCLLIVLGVYLYFLIQSNSQVKTYLQRLIGGRKKIK